MQRKYSILFILLTILVIVLFFTSLITGSVDLSIKEIWASLFGSVESGVVHDILISFRLPRSITAILCGVSLSVCGLQMQTVFRNPLADPYILGISSGAGLGVAFFVMGVSVPSMTIASNIFNSLGMISAAWIGALLVSVLLLSVSNKLKDNITLLIFGVMIGSVGSAIIGLLQYLSSAPALKNYVLWSMGSFAGLSYTELIIMGVLIAIGLGISIYNIKDLNVLLVGEDYAESLGLNTKAIRRRMLISVTLLTGSVTAFCGPIGFIGIAAPHLARMISDNANHKVLLPFSALTGIIMAQFADILSQMPGSSGTIPVNTVSALLGIPIILYIILRKPVR